MPQIHPYLNFDGTCREAFELYARVLGGTIEAMHTFGDSPMRDHVPAEAQDQVMHVTLRVGDLLVMGSDAPGGQYRPAQGMHVSVNVTDAAEGERIFRELSEGGTVTMPYDKVFWADGFGSCVDRFGTPWMVNAEAPT